MPFLGELAALTTAACWAGGSLLFTRAARRVGAFTLNHARVTLAFVFLTLIVLIARGTSWAPEAEFRNIWILMLSGFLGLTLGDLGYFSAFVLLGPRLTTLLMILAPPFTAILAIPFLGETMDLVGVLGMGLTLAGVIWVVRERQGNNVPRGHRIRGVVYGCLGSLGQAVGLILSKIGMGTVMDPLPATTIRMAAATVGVFALAAVSGRMPGLVRLARDPVARWATIGATVLGPVLGVWLSLVAVRYTQAGIAATLIAMTPIMILPLVMVVERERVSPRAAVGAVISVAGVAVLFLR
jgi:drug/metabolite transporter (DMT)-like permease